MSNVDLLIKCAGVNCAQLAARRDESYKEIKMTMISQERYKRKNAGKAYTLPYNNRVCGRCGAPLEKGQEIVEYDATFPRKVAHVECIYYPIEVKKIDPVPAAPATARGGGD